MVDIGLAIDLLLELEPVPMAKILAGRRLFPCGGLYVVYREETPVYVGKTARSLRLRMRDHERKSNSLLGEAFRQGDYDFNVCVIEPPEGLCCKEVELALIKELRPEYNRGDLLPSQYTGEARRRYEEEQQHRRERQEKLAHRSRVFYEVVNEFHVHVKDAEIAARAYIMEKTAHLSPVEYVDVQQLGLEAFEVYLAALDAG